MWHNALQQNIRNKCLEPSAPRKWGETAKMRNQEGHINEVYWALARLSEKQDKAMRPAWTAIERSPDEGRRWRSVGAAMEKAMKALGPGFDFEKMGSIWKGPIDIMKHDGNKENGWLTLGLGDWNAMLNNITKE